MKIFPFLFLLVFSSTLSSQTAAELNEQAKSFMHQNNFEKALPILRKAAALGNAESQYNLGYALTNGIGVQKNIEEAVLWYSKSSDNGFNDGHYAMMMAYGNGEGIAQNVNLAFKYALKCAENNDITCIWNVVSCYAIGNGIEQSDAKFRAWILLLAKIKNPENLIRSGWITSARLEIAGFYKSGKFGFPIDYYQAYLWYLIYNEFKVDFSILKQQEIIEEITAIEKLLPASKLNIAKVDADKLLGRNLKEYENRYKTSLD